MAYRLDKAQRRRLIAYLKDSKPDGWRNLLGTLNQGPGWKAYGLYYECVRFGSVSDSIFRERWSVDGDMPKMPSVARQSENGMTTFLLDIRQKRSQESSESSSGQFPAPEPSVASGASSGQSEADISSPPSRSKTPRAARENKRTVSLMIEPSLYDRVKRLAELQERSVGAQIRHAIRQDLERNANLLDGLGDDE